MKLIAMAVYDTMENERTIYTATTLKSLSESVDWDKHRLIVIDNDSCTYTKELLASWKEHWPNNKMTIFSNYKNLGTARAINLAIAVRKKEESVIKIDNDVVINEYGWVERMEEVIQKLPNAGIVGLKRKDVGQHPNAEGFYKTSLHMLPHTPGEPWRVVEESTDIMGTCTMFSSKLLDDVGYMRQPGVYGFDDSIMSHVSIMAGYKNYFIPDIDIDHIDTGGTSYMEVKRLQADEAWGAFCKLIRDYKEGKIPLYYDGGFKSKTAGGL